MIFNVSAQVVDLIDAPDAATARNTLRARLRAAGLELLEEPDAFISDDQSALAPDPDHTRLLYLLDDVTVQFWACPLHGRHNADAHPTVQWVGGVAHCLTPGCTKTSASPRT